jgi:mannose-1-phosphate guanylyltransferase
MAPLTRLLYGKALPKQYAAFDGERTMLQQTLDRIAPLAPRERTVVVVAAGHEDLARRQLAEFTGVDIAVQPGNAGTGPGVMFPLARLLARDPEARVVFFPADHHFARPTALVEAARRVLGAAASAPAGVALVGVPADGPDTALGWLIPGRRIGEDAPGAREIARFVEKPRESFALHLLKMGAVWNTFVIGGAAAALWRLAARQLPAQAALFARYSARVDGSEDGAVLAALYQEMGAADFSRDVLESSGGVGLVTMVDAGWSDWGTPERVIQTLEGTQSGQQLLARILAGSARLPARRAAAPLVPNTAAA